MKEKSNVLAISVGLFPVPLELVAIRLYYGVRADPSSILFCYCVVGGVSTRLTRRQFAIMARDYPVNFNYEYDL